MSELTKKAKAALQNIKTRLEGRLVEERKDSIILAIGGYLVEIPLSDILDQEQSGDDIIVVSLKPDAEVLMTAVADVETLVGVLSSRISRRGISHSLGYPWDCSYCSQQCECSYCQCSYCTDGQCFLYGSECSYCTDCTECSYCTDRTDSLPFSRSMRERVRLFRGRRLR
jgi:hypothetical protein